MCRFRITEWLLALILVARCQTWASATDTADLVRQLGSDRSKANRLQAIEEIKTLEPNAAIALIPDLTRSINDDESEVRIAAINAVVEIALQSKLECPQVFVEGMFHNDAEIRQLATLYVDAFDTVPVKFMPHLLKALAHSDPFVRAHATRPLERAGAKDERTVPALRKAMRDNEAQVQLNASVAFYHLTSDLTAVVPLWLKLADGNWELLPLEDAPITPRIVEKTESKDATMGRFAGFTVQIFARKDPEKMGKALIELLGDTSHQIRRSAAHAIGLMARESRKSRSALETLRAREALHKIEMDETKSVREAGKTALHGFTVKFIVPPDSSDRPENTLPAIERNRK